MPEIKFTSEWLKAGDNVRQGDHIRFLDEGHKDEKDQWVFKVGVIVGGSGEISVTKKFSLNKKNFNAISKVYGSNSDKWLGKEMRVTVIKVENPKTGDIVPAVRLQAPGVVEEGIEVEAEDEVLGFGDKKEAIEEEETNLGNE